MAWHNKYWDAVEQLYWTPSHLGLQSIPKSQWGDDPTLIQLPREWVKNGGTIYTRAGTYRSNAARMRTLEETLNHVFDITFAIAPDQVLAKLLHERAGIQDRGPFERVGSEVASRFDWGEANVTQHDGFFVSPQSILGVELKLGSSTWPEQVLKYLALTFLEERRSGRRSEVALLYITPHSSSAVWRQAGADSRGHLCPDFIGKFDPEKLNSTLKRLYCENGVDLQELSARLRLVHISWIELIDGCERMIAELDHSGPGDETLNRLLLGFIAAVRDHGGTGCALGNRPDHS